MAAPPCFRESSISSYSPCFCSWRWCRDAMNPKIQEDTRTLREFYPDSAMRHRVHYTFAHRFLPQYVHQNPYAFFKYLYAENRQEPTRFIQSRWSMIYEEMLGLAPR